MPLEHSSLSGPQKLPVRLFGFRSPVPPFSGALLGNEAIQVFPHLGYRPIPVRPISKLEALKRRRFTPETRADRVARSLAALYQPTSIRLTREQWKQLVEDPDTQDEV